MNQLLKSSLRGSYYFKLLGLVLIIIGIPILFLDQSSGSEIPLLVGLFMVLICAEKTQDERSVMMKTTSLYTAFIVSYAAKLLTTNLFSHQIITFQLVEINHFIILLLFVANAIFYSRMLIFKV